MYVVPTPIGNLADMTLRALEILQGVDLVLCEDTRRTRKLLSHYKISKPLVSCERFSEARRVEYVLARLEENKNIALVSDAGTPAVSDPGTRIVRSVRRRGFRVVALPGPSALVTAFAASGIEGPFRFVGFLPRKKGEHESLVREMVESREASVFYESPRRLVATLEALARLDPDRYVCVGREITKVHEEYIAGSAWEVLGMLKDAPVVGEITVVVEGASASPPVADHRLEDAACRLASLGVSPRDAAGILADLTGVPRREIYRSMLSARTGPAGGRRA